LPDAQQSAAVEEPQNLWHRVRLGFRLNIPNDQRVHNEVSRMTRYPNALTSRIQRDEPYLYFIVDEAQKRNMPLELALLPAIESGFHPHARSHMKAVGLWQFIPSTAKVMGLKRNKWYEGRCDIMASTRAALTYLQDLAQQFNGDWELALAAYNAGPGRVRRAIKANRRRGLATNFWSLKLPKETRQYVPRLLALAQVLRDPDEYGIRLRYLADEPYFQEVRISRPMKLRQVAQIAQVNTSVLSRLNPGLRHGIVGVGGHHRLLLPTAQANQFAAQLDPQENPQLANQSSYRVERQIAATPIQHTIPGAIPHLGHRSITYIVKPEESLATIASTYGLNPVQLAAWNNISPTAPLREGQVLHLQSWTAITARKVVFYQVQQGDSLPQIAQHFGVSIADLHRWNNFGKDGVKPGLRITLRITEPLKSSL
jgi:membrane-bound lytic murein transglycosylase D